MPVAQFRFHPSFDRFLPRERRSVLFVYPFEGSRSIKDMIEAAGVPHTEIGRILVQGEVVDFGYRVQAGDTVEIDAVNMTAVATDDPRFVADIHLGRLVAYLRMLGFDTLYPDDYRDEELARIASIDGRILLTRDIGLLKRRLVSRGHFVHETNPWKQLAEVLTAFDLSAQVAFFQRCTACNHLLETVDKASISDQILHNTAEHYDDFRRCPNCGKLYWKGSHYKRIEQFLRDLSTSPTELTSADD